MKDKTLGKYFLENFIKKINELTPNINFKKNRFLNLKKNTNPLQKTKEVHKMVNKLDKILKLMYNLNFILLISNS